jgi:outer membrane protein TolC
MGLWGGGLRGGDLDYRLPPQLPALPDEPETRSNVEIEAVRRRVDLVIARQEVATLAKSFKLDEATRYVSLLQLAGIYNGETTNNDVGTFDNVQRLGLDLDVSIPIFDSGEARLRGARETYMRAVNRLAERSINARSEARSAYDAYRSTWDIARFYQSRVLPLRRTISNEVLLRYNGMLVDVFELLIDARERIAASSASLEALRDFYLATADLQAALIVGDPTRNDKGERP